MRLALPLVLVLALAACSSKTGPEDSDSGIPDSGCTDCSAPWKVYTLDDTPSPNQQGDFPQIALVVSPDDTVGVAYFVANGTDDAGHQAYDLRYVSWKAGAPGAPEVARAALVRTYGLSLAFQADGEPAIAFLGGPPPLPPDQGGPAYWFQNDAVVAYRNQGTWTEQTAVKDSNEAYAGNTVSDQGNVVGLFPALGFDGTTAYLAYRDVHFGQSAGTGDYGGSDWELATGGPTSWGHEIIIAGGNDKLGYGAHSQMVIADGQPAIVSDEVFNSANASGKNVLFRWRQADGGWVIPANPPVLDTSYLQSGPSLAYDPQTGFGIAAVDANAGALSYVTSKDGLTWTFPDTFVQDGSDGWYPSLAFDPTTHDPSVAYYFCSSTSGVTEGSCPANQDELRIADFNSAANRWNISTVDTEGAFQPKLGFLSTGKRVIAFRDVSTGEVKLEVEQ